MHRNTQHNYIEVTGDLSEHLKLTLVLVILYPCSSNSVLTIRDCRLCYYPFHNTGDSRPVPGMASWLETYRGRKVLTVLAGKGDRKVSGPRSFKEKSWQYVRELKKKLGERMSELQKRWNTQTGSEDLEAGSPRNTVHSETPPGVKNSWQGNDISIVT